MATATLYAGSAIDNTRYGSGDHAWVDASYAAGSSLSDYAYSMIYKNEQSRCLDCYNYGFSIPSDATIDGILVEVNWRWELYSSSSSVQMLKAGTPVGTGKNGDFPSTQGWTSFGGATDKWGTTWTVAEVNASGFGALIRGTWTGGSSKASSKAEVFAVRITVYYTLPQVAYNAYNTLSQARIPEIPLADMADPMCRGLVGWWKSFPAIQGRMLLDVTPFANHATFGSSASTYPSWAKTSRGAVLKCADTAWAETGISSRYGFSTGSADKPFSAVFWANNATYADTGWLQLRLAGTTEYMFNFGTTSLGLINGRISDISNVNALLRLSANDLSASIGKWGHVGFTYDGSGSHTGISLYYNGQKLTTTNGSGGTYTTMRCTSASLRIGTSSFNDLHGGCIDDVRLFNRCLSEADVANIYADSASGIYAEFPRPFGPWKFYDPNKLQTIDDAIGATDVTGRSVGRFQTLHDSVGVVDPFGKSIGYAKDLAESLGLTDSLSDLHAFVKSLTDQAGLSDAVATVSTYQRAVSEVLGITDPTVTLAAYIRQMSDSMGLADSVAKSHGYGREVADLLGLVDDLVKLKILVQSILDSIGLTDLAIGGKLFSQDLADPVGIVDSVSKLITLGRVIDDLIGSTDDLSRITETYRAVDDALGVSDYLRRASVFTRQFSDSIGISDDVAWFSGLLETIDDAIGMTDSLDRQTAFVKAIADYLGLTDQVARTQGLLLSISDTVGLRDSTTDNLQKLTFLAAWLIVTRQK